MASPIARDQWADLATWVYASDDPHAGASVDDTPTLPGGFHQAATDQDSDQEQPAQPAKPAKAPDLSAPADAMRNMRGTLGHVSELAGRVPTPGGIGLLLAVLVFFWFAVIPVAANGKDTRLTLIWRTLLGQVHIPGDEPQAPTVAEAAQDAFWGAVWGTVTAGAGYGAGPDGMPPEATPAPIQSSNMPGWVRPRLPAYAYNPALGRK